MTDVLLSDGCITLEEHAVLPSLGDNQPAYSNIYASFPDVQARLADLSAGRLADMDAGHVSFQVVSQLPGLANWRSTAACAAANNELAAAVRKHPTRFGGLAALYMCEPVGAAAELERAVTQLGFLGAMVDAHLPDMTHYDGPAFRPVFEMAARLRVPIYIHPAPPSAEFSTARYAGAYGPLGELGIATGNWGWHEDVGLHVLKLFAAGVFAEFPDLKIVIGHMGELMPMMVDRIDAAPFFSRAGLGNFRRVWERNVWVTTSSSFSVRTLRMLLQVMPREHVLYSVDAPFISNTIGWSFLEQIAADGALTGQELKDFASGNAKKLFGLHES